MVTFLNKAFLGHILSVWFPMTPYPNIPESMNLFSAPVWVTFQSVFHLTFREGHCDVFTLGPEVD